MSRIIAAVIVSLVAGFAVGAWMTGDEASETGRPAEQPAAEYFDAAAPLEERLRRLEQVITEERDARLILEDQLQNLIAEIERIDEAGPRLYADRTARAEELREERQVRRSSERDVASMMRNYRDRRVATLVNGGFSEDQARRVLQQESEAQFKSLQAMHDAQRNGEALDPMTAMSGPQAILRSELGDDAYERYLSAQGQPTAVQVTQVLDGSPGSRAGLQSGDQIVSYNGERIFQVGELRQLTMQGQPGEDVIIEIDRDGVRMQLSVQRGPVGITGSGANIRTMNWWGGS